MTLLRRLSAVVTSGLFLVPAPSWSLGPVFTPQASSEICSTRVDAVVVTRVLRPALEPVAAPLPSNVSAESQVRLAGRAFDGTATSAASAVEPGLPGSARPSSLARATRGLRATAAFASSLPLSPIGHGAIVCGAAGALLGFIVSMAPLGDEYDVNLHRGLIGAVSGGLLAAAAGEIFSRQSLFPGLYLASAGALLIGARLAWTALHARRRARREKPFEGSYPFSMGVHIFNDAREADVAFQKAHFPGGRGSASRGRSWSYSKGLGGSELAVLKEACSAASPGIFDVLVLRVEGVSGGKPGVAVILGAAAIREVAFGEDALWAPDVGFFPFQSIKSAVAYAWR